MPRVTKFILCALTLVMSGWGFFAHRKINRFAVFTLPVEMIGFYKTNIRSIEEDAVNPDRRRYIIAEEAARHYIDLDDYGDSAVSRLPKYWKDATEKLGEDSLRSHGILPWHITRVYYELKDAFAVRDPDRIIRLSADLGHYIADAHVPLHTTKNYDGQLTGQNGIHAFWESRLPELFSDQYDFYVGRAEYVGNVQLVAWKIVAHTNEALDSVLQFEKQLSQKWGDKKFNFESQGRQTIKVFSPVYSKAYHQLLSGMVERQMRGAVSMTGSIWYTAWVDAGQPDLKLLINYKPSSEEIKKRADELKKWKEAQKISIRPHEIGD
jgi:hypothetical protein